MDPLETLFQHPVRTFCDIVVIFGFERHRRCSRGAPQLRRGLHSNILRSPDVTTISPARAYSTERAGTNRELVHMSGIPRIRSAIAVAALGFGLLVSSSAFAWNDDWDDDDWDHGQFHRDLDYEHHAGHHWLADEHRSEHDDLENAHRAWHFWNGRFADPWEHTRFHRALDEQHAWEHYHLRRQHERLHDRLEDEHDDWHWGW